MPLANYTTTVDALKTVGEIQGILVGHGAQSILINYATDKTVESLSFIVNTPHGALPFRLPANAGAVLKVLEKEAPPRYANYPQAVRVTWRILRDWVRAQMALLETDMVRLEQIFLPYMVMKDQKTVYDIMVDSQFLLTQGER